MSEILTSFGGLVIAALIMVLLLGVCLFIDMVRKWVTARIELAERVEKLYEVQYMLMDANNDLNRRVTELERTVGE